MNAEIEMNTDSETSTEATNYDPIQTEKHSNVVRKRWDEGGDTNTVPVRRLGESA